MFDCKFYFPFFSRLETPSRFTINPGICLGSTVLLVHSYTGELIANHVKGCRTPSSKWGMAARLVDSWGIGSIIFHEERYQNPLLWMYVTYHPSRCIPILVTQWLVKYSLPAKYWHWVPWRVSKGMELEQSQELWGSIMIFRDLMRFYPRHWGCDEGLKGF